MNCYKCGIKFKTEKEKNEHVTEKHHSRKHDSKSSRKHNDAVRGTNDRRKERTSHRNQESYVCPPQLRDI